MNALVCDAVEEDADGEFEKSGGEYVEELAEPPELIAC